ncbi:MMPL family transporter [Herbaspirillum sp. LeCh32-8]|uniref:MMPL family transporter n=1 Tax=Herbaspirillum sp. LeCh32-8 TaxID=2821356 RepID=UPI001AEB5C83|nr:MMPL family transporter [Herbaspirillum sp. LeCh32-8]MBP0597853.1 MMPL family transporter [Herbaspirillum sp. LeCh32-8]
MTKSGPKAGSLQRRLAALWLLAVLLLAGHNAWLWLGQRASPDTDILALLPSSRNDAVLQQAFSHMVDTSQQKVVVLVGDADWERATRAADAYLAALRPQAALVAPMAGSAQLQEQWLNVFGNSRTLLLTEAQRAQLAQASPQQWSQQALAGMYGAFGGPKLGAWQDDPFGLFAGWIQERARETPVRPRDGRLFVERDGKSYVLLLLELKASAFSLQAQEQVVPLLANARQAALAQAQAAEVVTGGVVLHAAAAGEQASGEMATIGTGSLIGILLLMWLSFRSLKPILYIAASIAVGCLGALSVSMLLFGHVHLLTLVFGASLIGIAQDYGIYFLCARLGTAESVSSPQLFRQLLPGLALMLLAAVIGYLGLAATPFPGLQQMAVFSALGLVFAWLTVACWFPQLVGPKSLRATRAADALSRSIERWPDFLGGHAWHLMLPAAVGVIGLCLAGLVKLQASDDIRALQKTPQALLDDQIRIGKLLDMAAPVQFYLVRGESADAVLQQEEQLAQRLQPLVDAHLISGVQAVSNWVPSQAMQQRNLALLQQSLLDARDGQPAALAQVAEAIGESSQWVAGMRARLLERARPMTPDAFLASAAGEATRHLWLGKVDGGYASIVALRGLSDYRRLGELAEVAAKVPGVQWVDKVGEISSVLKYYRQYMGWALLAAYAAIFALLSLRYRRRAWRALAPPLLATGLTLGLFGWLGLPLQLFHVLAALLVLGLGVDYGIFLLEPARRERRYAWLTVCLSAVSALLSFGLLALSGSPPLHAFGLTMLCGMLLVWLLAPCFTFPNRQHRAHEGNEHDDHVH